MAKSGDQQFNAKESGGEIQSPGGADAVQSRLQADSDLADPKNQRSDTTMVAQQSTEGRHIFDGPAYIKETYGSEANYFTVERDSMRHQFGLNSDASSEELYRKIVRDSMNKLKGNDPHDRAMIIEGLKEMNINPADVTHQKMLDGLLKRDGGAAGPGGKPDYNKAEQNMHQRFLDQLKSGNLPIDYN